MYINRNRTGMGTTFKASSVPSFVKPESLSFSRKHQNVKGWLLAQIRAKKSYEWHGVSEGSAIPLRHYSYQEKFWERSQLYSQNVSKKNVPWKYFISRYKTSSENTNRLLILPKKHESLSQFSTFIRFHFKYEIKKWKCKVLFQLCCRLVHCITS